MIRQSFLSIPLLLLGHTSFTTAQNNSTVQPNIIQKTPQVTVVPINDQSKSCAGYPSRISIPTGLDLTGPLDFVTHTDDSALNGLIASWQSSMKFPTRVLTITTAPPYLDAPKLYCRAGDLINLSPIASPTGPLPASATVAVPQSLGGSYALLGVMGQALQGYGHVIDGVRQEGVFAGANDQTTWAVRRLEGGNYDLKLIRTPSVRNDPAEWVGNWTTTFLKIVPQPDRAGLSPSPGFMGVFT